MHDVYENSPELLNHAATDAPHESLSRGGGHSLQAGPRRTTPTDEFMTSLAIKGLLQDADPVAEPEQDQEDDQNDHEDDAFAAGWAFSLAPRDEVTHTEHRTDQPLIEARRADRLVHVVSEDVIGGWASSQAAAVRADVAGADVRLSICAIDLAKTLDKAGLTGETSENVLVVENSSGVQIGTDNRQLNIHHFTVKRVRICLDKALANHLAADVATSSPRPQNSVGTLDGFDKVVIRNSHGVQIGNHNSQRNVFRHVITGLEMPLTDLFTDSQLDRVIYKLRERRIGSAQSDITTMLHRAFKRDASELFDALK
jgi:RIP homotypic interaction motif